MDVNNVANNYSTLSFRWMQGKIYITQILISLSKRDEQQHGNYTITYKTLERSPIHNLDSIELVPERPDIAITLLWKRVGAIVLKGSE